MVRSAAASQLEVMLENDRPLTVNVTTEWSKQPMHDDIKRYQNHISATTRIDTTVFFKTRGYLLVWVPPCLVWSCLNIYFTLCTYMMSHKDIVQTNYSKCCYHPYACMGVVYLWPYKSKQDDTRHGKVSHCVTQRRQEGCSMILKNTAYWRNLYCSRVQSRLSITRSGFS